MPLPLRKLFVRIDPFLGDMGQDLINDKVYEARKQSIRKKQAKLRKEMEALDEQLTWLEANREEVLDLEEGVRLLAKDRERRRKRLDQPAWTLSTRFLRASAQITVPARLERGLHLPSLATPATLVWCRRIP